MRLQTPIICGLSLILLGTLQNGTLGQRKAAQEDYPLSKVKSMRFAVTTSTLIEKDGITQLRKHYETQIAFVRPSSVRIETTLYDNASDPNVVTFLLNDAMISNGSTALILSRRLHQHYFEKAKKDLSLLDWVGVGEVSSEIVFSRNPFTMYKFVPQGKQIINGKSTFHYVLVNTNPQERQEDRRVELWLSDPARLPLRLSEYEKTAAVWREIERNDYHDWQLNPKLPKSTFSILPPKDSKEVPTPTSD